MAFTWDDWNRDTKQASAPTWSNAPTENAPQDKLYIPDDIQKMQLDAFQKAFNAPVQNAPAPAPVDIQAPRNVIAQPLDFARNMKEAATPIADKGILQALGDELGKALSGFGNKTTGEEVTAPIRDLPVLGGVIRGVETGLAALQTPSNVIAKPLSGLFELGLQKGFGDLTGSKAANIDEQYQKFADALWSSNPLKNVEQFGNAKAAYEEQRDPLTALSQAIFDPLNLIPANRIGEAQAIKRAVEATGDISKLEEAPMLAKLWLTLSKPHVPNGSTLETLDKLGAALPNESTQLRYLNPFTWFKKTPLAKDINFVERVQDYAMPLATDRSITRANLLNVLEQSRNAAKEGKLTDALREVMGATKIHDSADFRRLVSTAMDYAPDVAKEQTYQQAAKLGEAVNQWTATARPTRQALNDTLLLSEPFENLKAKLPASYQGAFTRFEKTLADYETGAKGTNVDDIRRAAQQLNSDIEQVGKLQLAADYVDHAQQTLAKFSQFAAPNLVEKMVNKIRPYESTLFIMSNPHSIAANVIGNWSQLAIHGVPYETIDNINKAFGRAYNGGFDRKLVEDVGDVLKQISKDERFTHNAPYNASLPKQIQNLPGIKQLGNMWQSAESSAKLRAFYKGWNNAYKSMMKYGDTIPEMPTALQDMIRSQMGDKGLRNVEKQIERALNTDEVRTAIKEGIPTWQVYRNELANALQEAFKNAKTDIPITPDTLDYLLSHGADTAINEAITNATRRARNGEDFISALTDEQQRLQMQSGDWQKEADAAYEAMFGKTADAAPNAHTPTVAAPATDAQIQQILKNMPERGVTTKAMMYQHVGDAGIHPDEWDNVFSKLLDEGYAEVSRTGNYKLTDKGKAYAARKLNRVDNVPLEQKPVADIIQRTGETPRAASVPDVTSGKPSGIASPEQASAQANKLTQVAKEQRHNLPSQLSENMADAARQMKYDLKQGEAGSKFANYDAETGDWNYGTVGTSNPRWYGDLVEKYRTNKQAVEAALNRIIEDNGQDTGLQVERVKEIILQQLADGLETQAGKMPPDWEARQLLGYPQDKVDEAFRLYEQSLEGGVQNGEEIIAQGQQEKGLLSNAAQDMGAVENAAPTRNVIEEIRAQSNKAPSVDQSLLRQLNALFHEAEPEARQIAAQNALNKMPPERWNAEAQSIITRARDKGQVWTNQLADMFEERAHYIIDQVRGGNPKYDTPEYLQRVANGDALTKMLRGGEDGFNWTKFEQPYEYKPYESFAEYRQRTTQEAIKRDYPTGTAGIDTASNGARSTASDSGEVSGLGNANDVIPPTSQGNMTLDAGAPRPVNGFADDMARLSWEARLNNIVKRAQAPEAIADRNIHAQLDTALTDSILEILKPYLQADFAQSGKLSPEANKLIDAYVNELEPVYREAKQAAQAVGKWYVGHTVLNYNNRWNIDDALGMYAPFTFYPIHMAANMTQDFIDKPALLAQYMRLRNSYADYTDPKRNNLPTRFADKIKIPLPFLPDWMGDGVFVNPFPTVFPVDSVFGLDALQRASYSALNGEPQDATSFISDLYGAHLPAKMAWQMLTGDRAELQNTLANLPPFRMARALTAPTDTGGVGGFAPFASKYDNYYIERELKNMLGNGEIDAKTFKATLLTRKGEVWDKAVHNAGLTNYTAPVLSGFSGFTGKVLTAGEQKYLDARQQKDALQQQLLQQYGANPNLDSKQQWEFLKSKGATQKGQPLADLLDQHPELDANNDIQFNRTAADDEKLYREYLISNIWDNLNNASDLQKRIDKAMLGDEFYNLFYAKSSRNLDAVSTQKLMGWANAVKVPMLDTATNMGVPEPYAVTWATDKQNQAYNDFNNVIASRLGDVRAMETAYFQLPTEQRKTFLAQNPQLKQYWDYKNQFYADNPDIKTLLQKAGAMDIANDAKDYAPADAKGAALNQAVTAIFGGWDGINKAKADYKANKTVTPELTRYWELVRAIYGDNTQTDKTTKTYYAPRNNYARQPVNVYRKAYSPYYSAASLFRILAKTRQGTQQQNYGATRQNNMNIPYMKGTPRNG